MSRLLKTGILFVLLFCTAVPVEAAKRERITKIKYMIGSVKVRRGKSTKWRPARVNMKLRASDAIRTFVESSVEIQTEEGSVIRLSENTTMEISNMKVNTRTRATDTKVKVMSGNIFAKVKKMTSNRSNFVFETPTATAAIRGTELGIEVGKGGTSVKVYKGVVFVKPAAGGRGANVKTNQMTFIKKGQRKVKVVKLVVEEKKDKEPVDTTGMDTTGADTTGTDSTLTDTLSSDTSLQDTANGDTVTDDEPADTTTGDTLETGDADTSAARLVLEVYKPNDGDVSRGGPLNVSGKTTAGAAVTVKGKDVRVSSSGTFSTDLVLPTRPGEYSFTVEAVLDGQTRTVSRTIKVSRGLVLTISEPASGTKITDPNMIKGGIRVAGVTTPGAEVVVGRSRATVDQSGNFSALFFIPEEEGTYDIDIEATLDGSAPIQRSVSIEFAPAKTELTLSVSSPANGQVIKVSPLNVQGVTNGNRVTVNDEPAVVVSGRFTYRMDIRETNQNWDLNEISVTASNDDDEMSKDIRVSVDYTSPSINTSKPLLTAVLPGGVATTQGRISISINDNTPDDIVRFTAKVDGERVMDEEEYGAKDKISFSLHEGQHRYEFSAKDRANNMSNTIVWEGACFTRRPNIVLRKPASGSVVLPLPPSRPGRSFTPQYDIEFEVRDLPDDDYNLLKEVKVINSAAGYYETLTSFSDTRFDFEVDLKRSGVNNIQITVTDKAGNELQRTVVITTR